MDIQGDSLQRQLKAFAVLQPVVLELQSSFLGPIQRQSAALDSPAGLKGTITAKVEVSAIINSVAALSDGFSVVMLFVRFGIADLLGSVRVLIDPLHRHNIVLHIRP